MPAVLAAELDKAADLARDEKDLQSFLNANGVDYVLDDLDDSKETKSPADYTVLLECLR
jgi:hypothetical protein